MGYMSGAWQKTKLICKCHGDDLSHEMVLEQIGKSLEYICPAYFEDRRKEGESQCKNRLSLPDHEKILNHIADTLISGAMNDEVINLTNHSWKRKGISYTCTKYSDDEIIVTVENKLLEKAK